MDAAMAARPATRIILDLEFIRSLSRVLSHQTRMR
jgi:hypothetical protein